MRIRKLTFENFGPFPEYQIEFPLDNQAFVLLVGKNNQGKSTIIRALKLINDATKVIGKTKFKYYTEETYFYKLLKQDVGDIRIGRLIYNYKDDNGKIICEFDDDFTIMIYLDQSKDIIYADYSGRIPADLSNLMGIIPPLGPVAENEEILSNTTYLKANINSSLAPRHLRNYFAHILTDEQFNFVQKIIESSWDKIKLDSVNFIREENKLECFYTEDDILREISWAGQGLQVWFQIITHFVLLSQNNVLVLDEPEVNLHPEKQNELASIINQYYTGSTIIATHSIELMNNKNITHIINVNKNRKSTSFTYSSNKVQLDLIRSEIGSNFNFIASQFEDVGSIIFTEHSEDYKKLKSIANRLNIGSNDYNIPINGFQQFRSTIYYKEAYSKLIGKNPKYKVILDRDYYPDFYLQNVVDELNKHKIEVDFIPGKEIENIFIYPKMYQPLFEGDADEYKKFSEWFLVLIEKHKRDTFADYFGILLKVTDKKIDPKTLYKETSTIFEEQWEDQSRRFSLVPGKKVLKEIRKYFQDEKSITLTDNVLVDLFIKAPDDDFLKLIKNLFAE